MTGAALPELLALTPAELGERLGGSGRAREIWAVLRQGEDPHASSMLSERARARLAGACAGSPLTLSSRLVSSCGTVKLALAARDSRVVEAVVIPHRRRTTVCVSSQVGCGRGCRFCMTATMGLVRSLHAGEIVAQVIAGLAEARLAGMPPVRNVVFMGMGEPLDNLAATRRAIGILLDPTALGLPPGGVTLSTVGTDPDAIRAACELPVRLAWSLHAANDTLRRRLVPTHDVPIAALRDAFVGALAPRAILFVEVTLIAGINDGDDTAGELVRFLAPLAGRVRVNLLPLNPGRSGLLPASCERVASFRETLHDAGYFCSLRRARGDEMAAACGQLAVSR